MPKRPISVTIVALLLIVAGAVGFVYHFHELDLRRPFQDDTIWVEVLRVLAIVAGVFLLRGCNWARWLAVAWIAFHVAISALHSVQQAVMHLVLLAVFAYVLLRPAASAFFRGAGGST
jgi:hypothetical protein